MSQGVVAMLDIDHFKRFNDEYGHRVGDVTLQKVAAVLRSSVRDEDIAGPLQRMSQGVVAMLDIDHFKRFNDEFGHRVGDVTLQKVAAVLRSSVRDEDFVYRYGGEEFVVVFSDTNAYEATMLANRLRLAVEAAPISGENLEPVGPVTISIGLAAMPAHGSDVENLIELADKAMYRAKESGRNRVCIWDVNDANSQLEAIA
jgi:diguanylate cyclase (GGDEF)-like protein